jgi:hypothetical protein
VLLLAALAVVLALLGALAGVRGLLGRLGCGSRAAGAITVEVGATTAVGCGAGSLPKIFLSALSKVISLID